MPIHRIWIWTAVVTGCFTSLASAWDYEGHRIVNQLALSAMPADFAPFTREAAAKERIAFLAGEPDRWRNTSDAPMKHYGSLDHYIDFEQFAMAGLDADTVPDTRYQFAAVFAAGRAAHLQGFPPIDPAKNADHTSEWCGFAPWTITEYYGKLKSAFSYLKAFDELGTPDEILNAQQNVIYLMGVMGHYVGDCSQPLHLTIHHNGWVGDNPKGYTKWPGFHSWIDGGYIDKAKIGMIPLVPKMTAAETITLQPSTNGRDPMFNHVMTYIREQHEFVEPLYVLEKGGAFQEANIGKSNAGRDFIETRLLVGSKALASIWLTAWRQAGPDEYLRGKMIKRNGAAATPVVPEYSPK